MADIIAARFETQAEADSALGALRAVGVASEESTCFFLNPPGQHAQYPIGGDAHHDEGTKHAGAAAKTVAAIGSAAGLAIGTATGAALGEPGLTAAGAIAGAGVGGYVGALAGGLTGSRGGRAERASVEEPVERHGGMMVAARIGGSVREEEVLRVLRAQGALEIERAQGEWGDAGWTDFDPRRPPDYIDPPSR
jgi:hypothetical protein